MTASDKNKLEAENLATHIHFISMIQQHLSHSVSASATLIHFFFLSGMGLCIAGKQSQPSQPSWPIGVTLCLSKMTPISSSSTGILNFIVL